MMTYWSMSPKRINIVEPKIGSVFSSTTPETLLMVMWERILGILDIIVHSLNPFVSMEGHTQNQTSFAMHGQTLPKPKTVD